MIPPRTDYRVIVVDPPWQISMGPALSRKARSVWRSSLPYKMMSDAEIASMPIAEWMADDAWCLMWTVTGRIEAAPGIMRAWGCQTRGWWCWHKDGGPQFPGTWCRNFELLLLGSRGRPRWTHTRHFPACFPAPRVRLEDVDPAAYRLHAERSRANGATHPPPRFLHSGKPAEFYSAVAERTTGPRLDVFARRAHPGWDAIGDEL